MVNIFFFKKIIVLKISEYKTNIIMKKLEFINEYFFPYLLSYESFKFLFCILMFSNIIDVYNWISVIIVIDMHHAHDEHRANGHWNFHCVPYLSTRKRIFALSFSEREELGAILTNFNNKRSTNI